MAKQMLGRLLERQEPAAWTLRSPDNAFRRAIGAVPTTTGLSVHEGTALNYTALFSCVRVLSESIASLPFKVFTDRADGGKEVDRDHPVYPLLHHEPNDSMSAFTFWETAVGHLNTWGNFYAEIIYGIGSTEIQALEILTPDRVTPQINESSGDIEYLVREADGTSERIISRSQMLHIKGPAFDGLVGYSPIGLFREAIGVGLAAEQFIASFYGNDGTPGGVITHPTELGEDGADNLRASWNEVHGGPGQSHKIAILDEGMTWQSIGIPQKDAEFLGSRKFQVTEMARVYRVPPHMIADLDRSTNNNIEHQSLEFVMHTLRPWLVRIEQEVNESLRLRETGNFAEFVVDGLLRGDVQTRTDANKKAVEGGWKTRNEVRREENMNPGGPELDEFLVPMNMTEATEDEETSSNAELVTSDDDDEEPDDRLALAEQNVAQTADRLRRKERKAIEAAVKRTLDKGHVDKFHAWVKAWYPDFRTESVDVMGLPIAIHCAAGGFGQVTAEEFVDEQLYANRRHLAKCVDGRDFKTAGDEVRSWLSHWPSNGKAK